jgi:site-specific recombinase
MFLQKKAKSDLRELLFQNFFENTQDFSFEYYIDIFSQIVDVFRPQDPSNVEVVSIQPLIKLLEDQPFLLENLKSKLNFCLKEKKINVILTDYGILENQNFWGEVKRRLNYKLIPNQPAKDTLSYILNIVFNKSSDAIWLIKIPIEELKTIFTLLNEKPFYDTSNAKNIYSQVLKSIKQLSQRCSGRVNETDVLQMVPKFELQESPFDSFEYELDELIKDIQSKPKNEQFISSDNLNYKQLIILHNQCLGFIDMAFQNAQKFGISLEVNQSLLRIKQQLHRIRVLLPTLIVNSKEEHKENQVQLLIKCVKYNCQKNNIRQLIDESTQLLSYEITQHTAKTGEKYITETRTEYFTMFKAALGGGLIVGILCIIKILFSKIPSSDLGYAFLYSLNYSLGFIIIYVLGFTLATKQPAMTATTLVLALEEGMKKSTKKSDKHLSFAKLFARLFRSQFIAFVGNVIMAFPIALGLIWLIDLIFMYNIAEAKWEKLITDLSPIHSSAIFHACIAGFFLFISGLIAGSQSNRFKFSNFYYRIAEHPKLIKTFGRKDTLNISQKIEYYGAGVISNFWFGIFLGSTASIGAFTGFDLDIRHITFAAGNLALSLYGSHFTVSMSMILLGVLGVGLIGFANFIVSFSLALLLAMRSRKIPFQEIVIISKSVWSYFKIKPMSFFFPPKKLAD